MIKKEDLAVGMKLYSGGSFKKINRILEDKVECVWENGSLPRRHGDTFLTFDQAVTAANGYLNKQVTNKRQQAASNKWANRRARWASYKKG